MEKRGKNGSGRKGGFKGGRRDGRQDGFKGGYKGDRSARRGDSSESRKDGYKKEGNKGAPYKPKSYDKDRPYKDKGGPRRDDRRDGGYKSGDYKGGSHKSEGGYKSRPPAGGRRQYRDRDSQRDGKGGRRADAAPARPKLPAGLWGVHAVEQAWLNPQRAVRTLYATERALKDFLPVYEQAKNAGLKRPMPVIVEKDDLDRSLPPGAVHQGLALDAEPLEEIFLQDLIIAAQSKERTILVLLDQVTDPHNVGAILRSASAFGARGVIMQTRHAPEVTGTLAKAACGAVDHIPMAYETNLSRALDQLREAGFTAVGLDERGEKDIGAFARMEKIVLVLGAEGRGLRPGLREHCDALAQLPTQGAIRSLNVSNAAAVALYAVCGKSA